MDPCEQEVTLGEGGGEVKGRAKGSGGKGGSQIGEFPDRVKINNGSIPAWQVMVEEKDRNWRSRANKPDRTLLNDESREYFG